MTVKGNIEDYVKKPFSSAWLHSLYHSTLIRSGHEISSDGKIKIGKKGWLMRVIILISLSIFTTINIGIGFSDNNPFVTYSSLMLFYIILVLAVGWLFFRNPAKGQSGNELVSVILPVYNQKQLILTVMEAIYRSTYKNIEVIIINDGSNDGTKEILDTISSNYPNLTILHKKNAGKRKAVSTGFNISTGKFIVIVDSDSVIEENAIEEMMKAFNYDPKIGGISTQAKVWNSEKNTITKIQDAWYDFAFNMHKASESVFGSVMCCSGFFVGYRREAIGDFLPYWLSSKYDDNEDIMLTSYVIAPSSTKDLFSTVKNKKVDKNNTPSFKIKKNILSKFSKNLLKSSVNYDDGENRVLKEKELVEWKTVYLPKAISYTEVPEDMKKFFNQLLRWKKGYLRTSFFVSSFFWKKSIHPFMKFFFYFELMIIITFPFIFITMVFYEPLILHQYIAPLTFLGGILISGLGSGLDYKYRDPKSKNWKYQLIMMPFIVFICNWLLIIAILTINKNSWLTR